MILDRPNPLGGVSVEGPFLKTGFHSFVGVFPACIKHGLTPAELALFYKDIEKINVNLSVVKMEGWKRTMSYKDTGLPWIAPSPNMPTENTAIVYPGMCLFEGLNISEGRGTTTPFEFFGAPFISPEVFLQELENLNLESVIFRPMYVKPTFSIFTDETIGGFFIHVTDKQKFKPFLTSVALTKTLHDCYKEDFSFLNEVYEFNDTHPAFDILTGSSDIRQMILSGEDLNDIKAFWKNDEKDYLDLKRKYHLYES